MVMHSTRQELVVTLDGIWKKNVEDKASLHLADMDMVLHPAKPGMGLPVDRIWIKSAEDAVSPHI